MSVLFVCLGNICRSPTAEGVFRRMVEEAGLAGRVHVDSAGTGDWHVGCAPDLRAVQAASRRGVDLSMLRARQVTREDVEAFDLVVAMDETNLEDLESLVAGCAVTMMAFAPHLGRRDVPDPYWGGGDGFERVLDLIEEAAVGLLDEVQRRLASSRLQE